MPFHIDRFRGSPDVQAMHPAARCGFLYLMASSWQNEECCLSPDPIDLASESGLGDDLWATYGARILRKFAALPDGRLRNSIVFEEWQEAKRIFEARANSARRTNSVRSPSRSPSRSADTSTLTSTYTKENTNGGFSETETQKQKRLDGEQLEIYRDARQRKSPLWDTAIRENMWVVKALEAEGPIQ